MISFDEFAERVRNVYMSTGASGSFDDTSISYEWVTGGRSGGSCWGDSEYYGVSGEPEPTNTLLDAILEEITPAISFMQYKRVQRLWESSTNTSNDYYGNHTDYAVKRMSLKQLYDELNVMNLLGE